MGLFMIISTIAVLCLIFNMFVDNKVEKFIGGTHNLTFLQG